MALMAWIKGVWRLLRLPLFVTPVADVTAAYLVTSFAAGTPEIIDGHVLLLLAGASAGLYLFGMVENDLVDVRRDRLLNVPRPLVTGEIGRPTAVAFLLATVALVACCAVRLPGAAVLAVVATFLLVNLYNLGAKRGPAYVAMPVMGLCRFVNYGIGVAAVIGVPRGIYHLELFGPTGPIWFRHAVALFFATAMITGYSILARRGHTVSTRPWQGVLVVICLAGLAIWIGCRVLGGELPLQTILGRCAIGAPPVARILALLVLPTLWPGGLWAVTGPERRPDEYGRFIERGLYWLILLDAAFVLDTAWRSL